MVFKIALFLVLEKKKSIFLFSVVKYFEVVWSYENDFKEIIIFNVLG